MRFYIVNPQNFRSSRNSSESDTCYAICLSSLDVEVDDNLVGQLLVKLIA